MQQQECVASWHSFLPTWSLPIAASVRKRNSLYKLLSDTKHTTFTVMEIKQRIINCNRNIFTDTYQSEDKHLVSQIFHRLQNSTSSRPKINIFVWLRIRKTFSWRLKSEQYLTFCKKKDFILCGTWIHWVWLNDHWMVSGINCSSYQLSYFYFTSFVLSWKHQQWLI